MTIPDHGRRQPHQLAAMIGFAVSMLALALASLAMIPALIHASGTQVWARIATGQAIGAVAAVVVGLGWGLTGPAAIACHDARGRDREYRESLLTRFCLLGPVVIIGGLITVACVSDHRWYAVAGMASSALIGLTASWYFVGSQQPWALLLTETAPRVLGTAAGIGVLALGSPAWQGILLQAVGMIMACAAGSWWILHRHPAGSRAVRRPVRVVIGEQRHGLSTTLTSTAAAALPIVIVGWVAPAALPVYAVLDKLLRQVNVGLTPYLAVFQAWIPRGSGSELPLRIRRALRWTTAVAAVAAVASLVVIPFLVQRLGRDAIHPTTGAYVLTAALIGLSLVEGLLSRACFPALQRVAEIARLAWIGAPAGLIAVAVGVSSGAAVGALAGLLFGLALLVGLEVVALRRLLGRRGERPGPPQGPADRAGAGAGPLISGAER